MRPNQLFPTVSTAFSSVTLSKLYEDELYEDVVTVKCKSTLYACVQCISFANNHRLGPSNIVFFVRVLNAVIVSEKIVERARCLCYEKERRLLCLYAFKIKIIIVIFTFFYHKSTEQLTL